MATSAPANAAFASTSPTTGRITTVTGLTLMNGMTAGYGDKDGTTSNPVPARGEIGRVPPKRDIKRVGIIRTVHPAWIGSGKYAQCSLYFMFNPNQIVTNFDIDPILFPSNQTYAEAGSGPVPIPGAMASQSVSWSLLFDRTYDMFSGAGAEFNRGTLRDVAALYNVLGAYQAQGIPMVNNVEVIFGQTESNQIWGFTGYLSEITVTHGIFRYNMIPVRTEVDLTLTAYYVNTTAQGTGGTTKTKALAPTPSSPSMINPHSFLPGAAKVTARAQQVLKIQNEINGGL